jgi:hypothetical protein
VLTHLCLPMQNPPLFPSVLPFQFSLPCCCLLCDRELQNCISDSITPGKLPLDSQGPTQPTQTGALGLATSVKGS